MIQEGEEQVEDRGEVKQGDGEEEWVRSEADQEECSP